MKLNAFWETYNLNLKKSYYTNNHRTFFWLLDEEWPFADLSENHPDIPDSEIFWRLPGHEAIIINSDFLMCFNNSREAKIWIKDNIPECVITWDIDWRDCFYIKHEG